MHLGVAEGDRCAPSSLFVPPEIGAQCLLCSTEDLCTLPPTPKRHLFGKELDSFAIHPSHLGMASACFSFLCLDLAKSPPCRKDLHKHLLELWGCCAVWGFTPALVIAFSLPSPSRTLVPHKQETQETVPATHRGLALSSSPRQRSRGDTRTRSR